MSTKGHKNRRGQPELYEVLKKRYTMTLTPTGADGLDAIASGLGISRSELVERIGRGLIPLSPDALTNNERSTLGKLSAS